MNPALEAFARVEQARKALFTMPSLVTEAILRREQADLQRILIEQLETKQ